MTNIFTHSQTVTGGLCHSSRFCRMAAKMADTVGAASTRV